MKVYTKTGDSGTTALVGGTRVPKNHPRLEAYGTVDELMAHVASLRDQMAADSASLAPYRSDLLTVLDHLMRLSAHLAAEEDMRERMPAFSADYITFLEKSIDRMQLSLPSIDKFTLPGGHPLVSLSHVVRTVCRRAERRVVTLLDVACVDADLPRYLNRLSDYFYLLGRSLAQEFQIKEILWVYDN